MVAVRNISPGFGSPPDGPPPADLDWNMWLGPASARKYNPLRGLYHFRWFWDTAGGQMTNLGAHHLDIVDWALGLDGLKSVMSVGGRYVLKNGGETPDTQDALFDLGKCSAAFVMREAALGESPSFGLLFHGTRGTLGINRKGYTITPDADIPSVNLIPGIKGGHPAGGPVGIPTTGEPRPRTKALTDTTGDSAGQYLAHARDFIDSIKARKTPVSDLASAHRTSVACHLANLSLRLGRSLTWEWGRNGVVDDKEANNLLTFPYREPWDRELKALGVTA
jgi:predicted dehydrogenase